MMNRKLAFVFRIPHSAFLILGKGRNERSNHRV